MSRVRASSGNARTRRFFAHIIGACAFAACQQALAYTTSSVATDGCHERITMDALRRVRSELPGAAFVAPTENERALIDDVPYEIDADMRDLGAVSMILGNRDVDLLGHSPNDLTALAPIHGDPNRQDEHCLRFRSDDEPDGSQKALERCREGIRARAGTSLTGLDSAGAPDPGLRLEIDAVLDLRGVVAALLPAYQVEIGRALHTLQDGFSHVYRNPADQHRVTVVLNYVDLAEERLDERVDGPPHNSSLDRCVDLDAFRAERLELATRASYELIRVTLEPNPDPASKRANVDEVLGRYLSLDSAARCSADNGWCGAPEKQYEEQRGCVCGLAEPRTSSRSGLALLGACIVLALALRRSRRRLRAHWVAASTLLMVLAAARPSAAQMAESPPPALDASVSSPPSPDEGRRSRFGLVVAAGGALQNGAVAASAGGVFRLSSNLLLGLEVEYNPWLSVQSFDVRSGSTNLYASGVFRFPLRFQRVNLRSTLQLGVTRTNFPLYGVPEGSVGPYVGLNLLGIDYELTKSVLLIVNPAHIAIPIPRVTGVPFAYPQYRVTIGVQFWG